MSSFRPLPALAGGLALLLGSAALGPAAAYASGSLQAGSQPAASSARAGVAPLTAPAPASAHAVIRTLNLGASGLAVGAGGAWTSSTADDTIYITSNNAKVTVVDPVSLDAVGSVTVGNYPIGVAASRDDTVYVVNANSDTMSVLDPAGLTVVQTVSVPDEPQAVAVSRVSDDTLYISSRGSSDSITTLNAKTLSGAVSTSIGSNATPHGLGLTTDDSAYIAVWPNEPRYFNSTTLAVSTLVALGTGNIGVAASTDDTVYVTNEGSAVVKSFASVSPGTISSVAVSSSPQGVAVGPDDTVYVANRSAAQVTVIDPRTNQVDDSVNLPSGSGPYGIAVTSGGLIVTANNFNSTASVVAALAPTLVTTSALPGATGSLTLAGLPSGVTVDDSTVESVFFGDDSVAWSRTSGTNTYTGVIPEGSGTVAVVVHFNGGNSAFAGNFTYAVPPPPPPVYPPSAPRDVVGLAGDRSVSVSWSAPASSGSFPVTNYQVVSSPSGGTCLVTATSCEVRGLSNGTAYTFTVRALNGAGWGPWSASSDAVTPGPPQPPPVRSTIVITGTRGEVRGEPGIVITGTTTGMGMGAILRPWIRFPGQSSYSEGSASILVDSTGGFTWERRTGKKVYVVIKTQDGSVKSNRLVIDR